MACLATPHPPNPLPPPPYHQSTDSQAVLLDYQAPVCHARNWGGLSSDVYNPHCSCLFPAAESRRTPPESCRFLEDIPPTTRTPHSQGGSRP